jgi:putative hydrolase of the HAD superfamily
MTQPISWRSKMTIRAVFWDMGGVILRTEDESGRRRWEERLGLPPGELSRFVFDSEVSREAVAGRASEDEIWAWVLARLGLPESERRALIEGFFGGDRVDERLVAFIRSLRPAFKTGMITNAWPNVRRFLEDECHLADVFDHIVVSAEEGMVKPDPRIYRIALERLGVAPGEAVFIDDMEENIAGAQAVGMHGIRFEGSEQAITAVQELIGPSVSEGR